MPFRSSVGWLGCRRTLRWPGRPMVLRKRVTTWHLLAAAVSKLMRNPDLVLAASKCQVVTRCRNTTGLPAHLSVRPQPNHPPV
ncbi:ethanolamine ammonia-lyase subunit EutB, partial [Klebsiella pneumoniae]|uniref:ethanolamine ammonia-lyase subunit EutB n=1 Tax=Klebsiella pneumoniae TaxID=573 RepID=UPI0035CCD73A